MNSHKPFKTIIASFTLIVFFITGLGINPNAFASATMLPLGEVSLPYRATLDRDLAFSIPAELGKLEYYKPGKGPMLVHIQTAHGHYEAQQQIRKILHHLDAQYSIKTLLLEGSAAELSPDFLNFFPKDRKLTQKIADVFTKHALVTGEELYLLDKQGATSRTIQQQTMGTAPRALGIENLKSYLANGESFAAALNEKKKTGQFLKTMDEAVRRLSAPYLSSDLRGFLDNLTNFESKILPLDAWLAFLKTGARKHLRLDLAAPKNQIQWPMLVRVFKIQELSSKLDRQKLPQEREAFLKALRRFLHNDVTPGASTYDIRHTLFAQIEQLLRSERLSQQLPDPETGLLFEEMVRQLPRDFNYDLFPNVRYYVGTLLLQSELKAERLNQEVEALSEKISARLAKTPEEKELAALFKDYRLLGKLFALELTPAEYERLAVSGQRSAYSKKGQSEKPNANAYRPSGIAKRFLSVNRDNRVKNIQFEHVAEIDQLFDTAMKFYEGAKTRDAEMMQGVERRLKETGADRAVIITGGFHADPFREHFSSGDYGYALISPSLTTSDETGKADYVQFVMDSFVKSVKTATYASSLGRVFANRQPLSAIATDNAVGFLRTDLQLPPVTLAAVHDALAKLRSESRPAASRAERQRTASDAKMGTAAVSAGSRGMDEKTRAHMQRAKDLYREILLDWKISGSRSAYRIMPQVLLVAAVIGSVETATALLRRIGRDRGLGISESDERTRTVFAIGAGLSGDYGKAKTVFLKVNKTLRARREGTSNVIQKAYLCALMSGDTDLAISEAFLSTGIDWDDSFGLPTGILTWAWSLFGQDAFQSMSTVVSADNVHNFSSIGIGTVPMMAAAALLMGGYDKASAVYDATHGKADPVFSLLFGDNQNYVDARTTEAIVLATALMNWKSTVRSESRMVFNLGLTLLEPVSESTAAKSLKTISAELPAMMGKLLPLNPDINALGIVDPRNPGEANIQWLPLENGEIPQFAEAAVDRLRQEAGEDVLCRVNILQYEKPAAGTIGLKKPGASRVILLVPVEPGAVVHLQSDRPRAVAAFRSESRAGKIEAGIWSAPAVSHEEYAEIVDTVGEFAGYVLLGDFLIAIAAQRVQEFVVSLQVAFDLQKDGRAKLPAFSSTVVVSDRSKRTIALLPPDAFAGILGEGLVSEGPAIVSEIAKKFLSGETAKGSIFSVLHRSETRQRHSPDFATTLPSVPDDPTLTPNVLAFFAYCANQGLDPTINPDVGFIDIWGRSFEDVYAHAAEFRKFGLEYNDHYQWLAGKNLCSFSDQRGEIETHFWHLISAARSEMRGAEFARTQLMPHQSTVGQFLRKNLPSKGITWEEIVRGDFAIILSILPDEKRYVVSDPAAIDAELEKAGVKTLDDVEAIYVIDRSTSMSPDLISESRLRQASGVQADAHRSEMRGDGLGIKAEEGAVKLASSLSRHLENLSRQGLEGFREHGTRAWASHFVNNRALIKKLAGIDIPENEALYAFNGAWEAEQIKKAIPFTDAETWKRSLIALSQKQPRGSVAILGSGRGYDIPLLELTLAFSQVVLVELDDSVASDLLGDLRKGLLELGLPETEAAAIMRRVRFQAADLSGVAAEFSHRVEELKLLGKSARERMDLYVALLKDMTSKIPETLPVSGEYSLVVSSLLTSAMSTALNVSALNLLQLEGLDREDYLEAKQGFYEALGAHHLDHMKKLLGPGGKIYWSDTVEVVPVILNRATGRENYVMDQKQLMFPIGAFSEKLKKDFRADVMGVWGWTANPPSPSDPVGRGFMVYALDIQSPGTALQSPVPVPASAGKTPNKETAVLWKVGDKIRDNLSEKIAEIDGVDVPSEKIHLKGDRPGTTYSFAFIERRYSRVDPSGAVVRSEARKAEGGLDREDFYRKARLAIAGTWEFGKDEPLDLWEQFFKDGFYRDRLDSLLEQGDVEGVLKLLARFASEVQPAVWFSWQTSLAFWVSLQIAMIISGLIVGGNASKEIMVLTGYLLVTAVGFSMTLNAFAQNKLFDGRAKAVATIQDAVRSLPASEALRASDTVYPFRSEARGFNVVEKISEAIHDPSRMFKPLNFNEVFVERGMSELWESIQAEVPPVFISVANEFGNLKPLAHYVAKQGKFTLSPSTQLIIAFSVLMLGMGASVFIANVSWGIDFWGVLLAGITLNSGVAVAAMVEDYWNEPSFQLSHIIRTLKPESKGPMHLLREWAPAEEAIVAEGRSEVRLPTRGSAALGASVIQTAETRGVKSRQAFTIVELLISVAVLGGLAWWLVSLFVTRGNSEPTIGVVTNTAPIITNAASVVTNAVSAAPHDVVRLVFEGTQHASFFGPAVIAVVAGFLVMALVWEPLWNKLSGDSLKPTAFFAGTAVFAWLFFSTLANLFFPTSEYRQWKTEVAQAKAGLETPAALLGKTLDMFEHGEFSDGKIRKADLLSTQFLKGAVEQLQAGSVRSPRQGSSDGIVFLGNGTVGLVGGPESQKILILDADGARLAPKDDKALDLAAAKGQFISQDSLRVLAQKDSSYAPNRLQEWSAAQDRMQKALPNVPSVLKIKPSLPKESPSKRSEVRVLAEAATVATNGFVNLVFEGAQHTTFFPVLLAVAAGVIATAFLIVGVAAWTHEDSSDDSFAAAVMAFLLGLILFPRLFFVTFADRYFPTPRFDAWQTQVEQAKAGLGTPAALLGETLAMFRSGEFSGEEIQKAFSIYTHFLLKDPVAQLKAGAIRSSWQSRGPGIVFLEDGSLGFLGGPEIREILILDANGARKTVKDEALIARAARENRFISEEALRTLAKDDTSNSAKGLREWLAATKAMEKTVRDLSGVIPQTKTATPQGQSTKRSEARLPIGFDQRLDLSAGDIEPLRKGLETVRAANLSAGKNMNLKDLLALARRLNPKGEFLKGVDPDALTNATSDQFTTFLRQVFFQVFMPAGFFARTRVINGEYRVSLFSAYRGTLKTASYLNSRVWSVDINDPALVEGLTTDAVHRLGPVVAVDQDRLTGAAMDKFEDLLTYIGRYTDRSAFLREYDRVLKERDINASVFIGMQRTAQEAPMLQGARDFVFGAAMDGSSELDYALDPDIQLKTVKSVVQKDATSEVLKSVNQWRFMSVPRQLALTDAALRIGYGLGGIIATLDSFSVAGKPDHAYAAFLGYVFDLYAEIMTTSPTEPRHLAARAQLEALSAEFRNGRGFDNDAFWTELLARLKQHGGNYSALARNASELVKAVYAKNFVTDEQRSALIKQRSEARGEDAALDEKGYQSVAKTGSVREMKVYVQRVMASMDLKLNRSFVDDVYGTADSALQGFSTQFTKFVPGVKDPVPGAGVQTLEKMKSDLTKQTGTWVIRKGGASFGYSKQVAAAAQALAMYASIQTSDPQSELDYVRLADMGDSDAMELYVLRVVELLNLKLNPKISESQRLGWIEGIAPWYVARVESQVHFLIGEGAQSLNALIADLQKIAQDGYFLVSRSEARFFTAAAAEIAGTIDLPALKTAWDQAKQGDGVLLIEESDVSRAALSGYLSTHGKNYKVEAVASIRDALAAILASIQSGRGRPLIVINYKRKDFSGPAFIEFLRTYLADPRVILTSTVLSEDRINFFRTNMEITDAEHIEFVNKEDFTGLLEKLEKISRSESRKPDQTATPKPGLLSNAGLTLVRVLLGALFLVVALPLAIVSLFLPKAAKQSVRTFIVTSGMVSVAFVLTMYLHRQLRGLPKKEREALISKLARVRRKPGGESQKRSEARPVSDEVMERFKDVLGVAEADFRILFNTDKIRHREHLGAGSQRVLLGKIEDILAQDRVGRFKVLSLYLLNKIAEVSRELEQNHSAKKDWLEQVVARCWFILKPYQKKITEIAQGKVLQAPAIYALVAILYRIEGDASNSPELREAAFKARVTLWQDMDLGKAARSVLPDSKAWNKTTPREVIYAEVARIVAKIAGREADELGYLTLDALGLNSFDRDHVDVSLEMAFAIPEHALEGKILGSLNATDLTDKIVALLPAPSSLTQQLIFQRSESRTTGVESWKRPAWSLVANAQPVKEIVAWLDILPADILQERLTWVRDALGKRWFSLLPGSKLNRFESRWAASHRAVSGKSSEARPTVYGSSVGALLPMADMAGREVEIIVLFMVLGIGGGLVAQLVLARIAKYKKGQEARSEIAAKDGLSRSEMRGVRLTGRDFLNQLRSSALYRGITNDRDLNLNIKVTFGDGERAFFTTAWDQHGRIFKAHPDSSHAQAMLDRPDDVLNVRQIEFYYFAPAIYGDQWGRGALKRFVGAFPGFQVTLPYKPRSAYYDRTFQRYEYVMYLSGVGEAAEGAGQDLGTELRQNGFPNIHNHEGGEHTGTTLQKLRERYPNEWRGLLSWLKGKSDNEGFDTLYISPAVQPLDLAFWILSNTFVEPSRSRLNPRTLDLITWDESRARSENRSEARQVVFHSKQESVDAKQSVADWLKQALAKRKLQPSDLESITIIVDYPPSTMHTHTYDTIESFESAHQGMILGQIYNISFSAVVRAQLEARDQDGKRDLQSGPVVVTKPAGVGKLKTSGEDTVAAQRWEEHPSIRPTNRSVEFDFRSEMRENSLVPDEDLLVEANFESALDRVKNHRLTIAEQKQLSAVLRAVWHAALPYYEKGKNFTPMSRHAQVVDAMVQICLRDGVPYQDFRNSVILALLHDVGYPASAPQKFLRQKIKAALQDGNKEQATALAKEAIAYRLVPMKRGSEWVSQILTPLVEKNPAFEGVDVALIAGATAQQDNPSVEKLAGELRKLDADPGYAPGAFLFSLEATPLNTLTLRLREAARLYSVTYQGVVKDLLSEELAVTPEMIKDRFRANKRDQEAEYQLYRLAGKDDGRFIKETLYRTAAGYEMFTKAKDAVDKELARRSDEDFAEEFRSEMRVETELKAIVAGTAEGFELLTAWDRMSVQDAAQAHLTALAEDRSAPVIGRAEDFLKSYAVIVRTASTLPPTLQSGVVGAGALFAELLALIAPKYRVYESKPWLLAQLTKEQIRSLLDYQLVMLSKAQLKTEELVANLLAALAASESPAVLQPNVTARKDGFDTDNPINVNGVADLVYSVEKQESQYKITAEPDWSALRLWFPSLSGRGLVGLGQLEESQEKAIRELVLDAARKSDSDSASVKVHIALHVSHSRERDLPLIFKPFVVRTEPDVARSENRTILGGSVAGSSVVFHSKQESVDAKQSVADWLKQALAKRKLQPSDLESITIIVDYPPSTMHTHTYDTIESFESAHQGMILGQIYNISFSAAVRARSEARPNDISKGLLRRALGRGVIASAGLVSLYFWTFGQANGKVGLGQVLGAFLVSSAVVSLVTWILAKLTLAKIVSEGIVFSSEDLQAYYLIGRKLHKRLNRKVLGLRVEDIFNKAGRVRVALISTENGKNPPVIEREFAFPDSGHSIDIWIGNQAIRPSTIGTFRPIFSQGVTEQVQRIEGRSEAREQVTIPISEDALQRGEEGLSKGSLVTVQGILLRVSGSHITDQKSREMIAHLSVYVQGSDGAPETELWLEKGVAKKIPLQGADLWATLISGTVGKSVTIEVENRSEMRDFSGIDLVTATERALLGELTHKEVILAQGDTKLSLRKYKGGWTFEVRLESPELAAGSKKVLEITLGENEPYARRIVESPAFKNGFLTALGDPAEWAGHVIEDQQAQWAVKAVREIANAVTRDLKKSHISGQAASVAGNLAILSGPLGILHIALARSEARGIVKEMIEKLSRDELLIVRGFYYEIVRAQKAKIDGIALSDGRLAVSRQAYKDLRVLREDLEWPVENRLVRTIGKNGGIELIDAKIREYQETPSTYAVEKVPGSVGQGFENHPSVRGEDPWAELGAFVPVLAITPQGIAGSGKWIGLGLWSVGVLAMLYVFSKHFIDKHSQDKAKRGNQAIKKQSGQASGDAAKRGGGRSEARWLDTLLPEEVMGLLIDVELAKMTHDQGAVDPAFSSLIGAYNTYREFTPGELGQARALLLENRVFISRKMILGRSEFRSSDVDMQSDAPLKDSEAAVLEVDQALRRQLAIAGDRVLGQDASYEASLQAADEWDAFEKRELARIRSAAVEARKQDLDTRILIVSPEEKGTATSYVMAHARSLPAVEKAWIEMRNRQVIGFTFPATGNALELLKERFAEKHIPDDLTVIARVRLDMKSPFRSEARSPKESTQHAAAREKLARLGAELEGLDQDWMKLMRDRQAPDRKERLRALEAETVRIDQLSLKIERALRRPAPLTNYVLSGPLTAGISVADYPGYPDSIFSLFPVIPSDPDKLLARKIARIRQLGHKLVGAPLFTRKELHGRSEMRPLDERISRSPYGTAFANFLAGDGDSPNAARKAEWLGWLGTDPEFRRFVVGQQVNLAAMITSRRGDYPFAQQLLTALIPAKPGVWQRSEARNFTRRGFATMFGLGVGGVVAATTLALPRSVLAEDMDSMKAKMLRRPFGYFERAHSAVASEDEALISLSGLANVSSLNFAAAAKDMLVKSHYGLSGELLVKALDKNADPQTQEILEEIKSRMLQVNDRDAVAWAIALAGLRLAAKDKKAPEATQTWAKNLLRELEDPYGVALDEKGFEAISKSGSTQKMKLFIDRLVTEGKLFEAKSGRIENDVELNRLAPKYTSKVEGVKDPSDGTEGARADADFTKLKQELAQAAWVSRSESRTQLPAMKKVRPVVVLVAKAAAGKGTVSGLFSKVAEDMLHISTGDLLAEAVTKKTAAGIVAERYMKEGKLVPDDVMMQVLEAFLLLPENLEKGLIFDGYPRNLDQAVALDGLLEKLGLSVDLVLHIDISDEEAIRRMSERWVCPKCRATYNNDTNKPRVKGMCDHDGVALEKRRDDSDPVAARKRLAIANANFPAILAHYENQGKVSTLSAELGSEAIAQALIGSYRVNHPEMRVEEVRYGLTTTSGVALEIVERAPTAEEIAARGSNVVVEVTVPAKPGYDWMKDDQIVDYKGRIVFGMPAVDGQIMQVVYDHAKQVTYDPAVGIDRYAHIALRELAPKVQATEALVDAALEELKASEVLSMKIVTVSAAPGITPEAKTKPPFAPVTEMAVKPNTPPVRSGIGLSPVPVYSQPRPGNSQAPVLSPVRPARPSAVPSITPAAPNGRIFIALMRANGFGANVFYDRTNRNAPFYYEITTQPKPAPEEIPALETALRKQFEVHPKVQALRVSVQPSAKPPTSKVAPVVSTAEVKVVEIKMSVPVAEKTAKLQDGGTVKIVFLYTLPEQKIRVAQEAGDIKKNGPADPAVLARFATTPEALVREIPSAAAEIRKANDRAEELAAEKKRLADAKAAMAEKEKPDETTSASAVEKPKTVADQNRELNSRVDFSFEGLGVVAEAIEKKYSTPGISFEPNAVFPATRALIAFAKKAESILTSKQQASVGEGGGQTDSVVKSGKLDEVLAEIQGLIKSRNRVGIIIPTVLITTVVLAVGSLALKMDMFRASFRMDMLVAPSVLMIVGLVVALLFNRTKTRLPKYAEDLDLLVPVLQGLIEERKVEGKKRGATPQKEKAALGVPISPAAKPRVEALPEAHDSGTTTDLGKARSEMRKNIVPAKTVEELMTPVNLIVIQRWYAGILPTWFLKQLALMGGQTEAIRAIGRWIGEPLTYGESETSETAALETLLPGQGKLVAQPWTSAGMTMTDSPAQTVKTEGGTLALGSDLFQRYLENKQGKQALFALLKPFAANVDRPVLVTVGSPDLMNKITAALLEKDVAAPGEFETRGMVIQNLANILRVEPLKDAETEVEALNRLRAAHQGGMTSLHLNGSMFDQLNGDGHFAFGEEIGSEDLMVASVLAGALKSLADLLLNIPNAQVRRNLLKKFVEENLQGVEGNGWNFTITHLADLAQSFVTRALIERAA